MASPAFLERGHAVVGGHLFSPRPPKRVLADSLMQESRILPCDRDVNFGSPFMRKVKDGENALTASFVETDSVISSCMLTSESFYGQPDTTSEAEFASIDDPRKVDGGNTKAEALEATSVGDLPAPKLRKRDVNWGDRSSIRLSIEVPKSVADAFSPKVLEEVNDSRYFKICFGTEFSDEEEENRSLDDVSTTKKGLEINLTCSMTSVSTKKRKKPLMKVCFLSAATSALIGVIESEDGMLSMEALQKLSLPQIQIIVNDLLNQISEKNLQLMKQLPLRDDLILEKEEKQAYLDRCSAKNRSRSYRPSQNHYASPIGPKNTATTSAFNPNPEYRYPYNSPPQRLSSDRHDSCAPPAPKTDTQTTSSVGTRLKTCISQFFSGRRRQRQPQSLSFESANLKSKSF
uniref:SCHIP-1 domain-containing protein n=2 Tax=Mesocestoides corti TaxID=53468 RepID=A0A5K3ENR6_MESCO